MMRKRVGEGFGAGAGGNRHRRTGIGRVAAAATAVVLGTGSLTVGVLAPSIGAGAVTAAASTLYVGNLTAKTVSSFGVPATGNVAPGSVMTYKTGTTDSHYAMAFDAEGNLWTANYANRTVTEYAPGQLDTSTATPIVTLSTDGTGSLYGPFGLAFDGAGNLWVADYTGSTVVEFTTGQLTASGSPVPAVTIQSNGGSPASLTFPADLAFDTAGDLLVTNTSQGLGPGTISEYSPSQLAAGGAVNPVRQITSVATSLYYPSGLAFDANGNLWVANADTGTLVEYLPSQFTVGGALVPAKKITGFQRLWQTVVDSAGNLWVATETTSAVFGFSPAQLAGSGGALTPAYAIKGTATGLTEPAGLAVKTAPTVTNVVPHTGPAAGGYTVTVHGTGFTSATTVDFGSVPATSVSVVSPFTLNAVAPAGLGTVDVTATTFGGTSTTSPADRFTYAAAGYTMVGSDGGVFSFGNVPFVGSLPGLGVHVNNVVGIVPTSDAKGYWMVGSDGGAFAFGDAGFVGSLPGLNVHVNNIVGIVPTADGQGYWMVGSDGGVFAFGDAGYLGSLPGLNVHVNNIVGIVPTADDQGYWMVGSDGGVFAFGDAGFVGSLPGIGVKVSNVVGIVGTADAQGYWMVGRDGGVFNFGDAGFVGSLPGLGVKVNNIVGIIGTADAGGYTMIGSDGGVFTFGDATFFGSLPGLGVRVSNIVGIVAN